MARLLYHGNIEGEFEGFNDENIFKLRDGSYWMQAQYQYWYHYAFCPEATVTELDGSCILTVEGQSVPVRRITNVIEGQIDGTFNGWGWSDDIQTYEWSDMEANNVQIRI